LQLLAAFGGILVIALKAKATLSILVFPTKDEETNKGIKKKMSSEKNGSAKSDSNEVTGTPIQSPSPKVGFDISKSDIKSHLGTTI
jgi:hypothetical protein